MLKKKTTHARKKSTKGTYGLALSGGAALGAYQAGTIQAFFEAGLDVRAVAGSSVGALNGYLAATGQIETMLRFWKDIDQRRLITVNSFTKLFFSTTPSLLTDQIQRELVEKTVRRDELIRSGREYICTAISIHTGQLHYFECHKAKTDKELQDYILASAAVPGIFPPITIGDELFMDGGLVRNTPVEALEQKKLTTIIAVSMESESYPVEPLQNTGQIALRTISIFFRSQANDAIERSINSVKRRAKNILLLRPQHPLAMQQYEFDPKKINQLVQQGYDEAKLFILTHELN